MKNPIFFACCFLMILGHPSLFSQTEKVRALAAFDSLSIEGEAFFYTPKYQIVIGGRLCSGSPAEEICNFTNDLVVIDRIKRQTWAIPLANLPAKVADQFSAVGLCTTLDADTAFVLGGYGFEGNLGAFTTIGQMTRFPLEKTVEKLLDGHRADANFQIVYDRQLAVFDGQLMKIGDYFMLFGGHRMTPIMQEPLENPVLMNDLNYEGELRSWRFECPRAKICEVAEFKICERAKDFIGCIPKQFFLDEKIRPDPDIDQRKP